MGRGATHRKDRSRRKGRARYRSQRDHGAHATVEALVDAAVASAFTLDGRPARPQPELLERLADRHTGASHALARALLRGVTFAWQQHWQPADLPRALSRNCGTAHARLGAEAILRELRTYGPGPLPPRWQAQVDAIDPGLAGLDLGEAPGEPSWAAPAHPSPERRLEALVVAVETLAFLRSLPCLPKIGPVPGERFHGPASATSRVDPDVLHKVASLLAKAESTTFPEEAEALTAKAQQLMARHAIDMAVVDAQRSEDGGAPVATARRVGIDDPYAGSKAILLQVIADANRCRSVWSKAFAFATVFGEEVDLDVVEVLYTSLLVQSTRTMISASPPGRSTAGATRSFRQSFLVSFANRIGERLQEAVASAVQDAAADHSGQDLLPVLADREAAADDACREAFPSLRTTRTTAKNVEGWQAGRRAADRADLDLADSLGQGKEPALGAALRPGTS